jgi:hypothetical protein
VLGVDEWLADKMRILNFLIWELLLPTIVFSAALMMLVILYTGFVSGPNGDTTIFQSLFAGGDFIGAAIAFVIALVRLIYRIKTGHYERNPKLGQL